MRNTKKQLINKAVWSNAPDDTTINLDSVVHTGVNTIQYRRSDDSLCLMYCSTEVIRLYPNGDIKLNSGGWLTATTKKRINSLLPSNLYLYQSDFDWYIMLGKGLLSEGMIYNFQDNMMIKPWYTDGYKDNGDISIDHFKDYEVIYAN